MKITERQTDWGIEINIDMENQVICDDCNEDWTNRPETGGFIFGSRGICPDCEPKWRKSIKETGEEWYIKAECPPNQSFYNFIMDYR